MSDKQTMADAMAGFQASGGVFAGILLIAFGLLVTLKIIPWHLAPAVGLGLLALIGLYVWFARRHAFTGIGLTAAGGGGAWWLLPF